MNKWIKGPSGDLLNLDQVGAIIWRLKTVSTGKRLSHHYAIEIFLIGGSRISWMEFSDWKKCKAYIDTLGEKVEAAHIGEDLQ